MKALRLSQVCMLVTAALISLGSVSGHAASLPPDESGPSNGTDYVKVLFADAQYDVIRSLAPIANKDLQGLGLQNESLGWLLTNTQANTRFELLKYFLRKMELTFQQGPCTDGTGKPASICFFNDPNVGPYVAISIGDNKMTNKDQAMAMLIHEAGHFTGETDHLLLDRIGVDLVNAVKLPSLLTADAQSTEIVANIFAAKSGCEAGTTSQAQMLAKQALVDLRTQCSNRQINCDLTKTEFIFQGTQIFTPGVGFEMKVTCQVKAVLGLR